MARPDGLRRSALFLVLFASAGFLGRATIIDDTAIALVWPAAGVAVLWRLANRGAVQRWVDLGLIAGATLVVNDVTGSSHAMSVVFVVANLVQVVVVTWLVEHVTPRLPTLRLGAPFTTPRALVRLVAAAALGCVPSALVGMVGAWLAEDLWSVAAAVTWWGRNAVGIVGIVSVALLLKDPTAVAARPRKVHASHVAESAVLLAATVALLAVDLTEGTLPLAFFLPALTVWAGMRFSSTFVAVHSLVAGAVAVLLTLAGEGPFARVEPVEMAALLSQLFVGMTVVLGLFLTMARRENQVLAADLREARDAFRQQARVLETIIMSMDDGLVVVDPDDRVTLVNRAAARLFGGSPPPAGTRLRSVVLRRADGTPLADEDRPSAHARAGQPVRMDVRPADPQDTSVYAVTATPLVDGPDSAVAGAVMVYHDVTAERAQQHALAAYASVVAHDLLNPLSVVSGWAELLEDSFAGDARATDALARIRSATARMRELVNDLLADAQSRDLTLDVRVIDMEALAHDALKGVVDAARVMILPIPPVTGDPRLLRQVLANLVANSVKYAAEDRDPEITISGRLDDAGDVVVEVADRGIGIPEEHLAAVFESFHRVPGTGRQGTGLGLAICRRIVRRHGGRITARQRDDGPGTVISMTLPGVAGGEVAV